jgi:hypothetical protein
MGDATEPGGPADAGDAEGTTDRSTALGVVFGMLGLVLMLTLDDARAAGLPFLVLGIVYSGMGLRRAKGTDPERQDGDSDGDVPGA